MCFLFRLESLDYRVWTTGKGLLCQHCVALSVLMCVCYCFTGCNHKNGPCNNVTWHNRLRLGRTLWFSDSTGSSMTFVPVLLLLTEDSLRNLRQQQHNMSTPSHNPFLHVLAMHQCCCCDP